MLLVCLNVDMVNFLANTFYFELQYKHFITVFLSPLVTPPLALNRSPPSCEGHWLIAEFTSVTGQSEAL